MRGRNSLVESNYHISVRKIRIFTAMSTHVYDAQTQ